MKSFNIILLTLLLTSSCNNDKKKEAKGNYNSKPFPVVLDTVGVDKFLYSHAVKNPTWLSTSNYNFYFIGAAKDTVYLSPHLCFSPTREHLSSENNWAMTEEREKQIKEYFLEWDEERSFKGWLQSKIVIQVDTTTNISGFYPVMLTNMETDTVFIGYGEHIPLILEATDSSGNWKPIQERFRYFCGNGVGAIILPPLECVLTLAPIFQGNYKTKLRLTLGDNHSKPFDGFIFYRQFESIFDKHGQYKEEYISERGENKETNR